MAKAYICEKCGKVFDKNDRFESDGESSRRYYLPLIFKTSDDLYINNKHRAWWTRYFCAECGYKIEQFMKGGK